MSIVPLNTACSYENRTQKIYCTDLIWIWYLRVGGGGGGQTYVNLDCEAILFHQIWPLRFIISSALSVLIFGMHAFLKKKRQFEPL